MSRVYDNWGRLVSAVVRQEELRELCLASSLSSGSSDLSSLSAHSASSSSYLQSIAANHSQNDNVDNSHALRPENFYVNNKPLDSRELVLLLSCWNPPLNLRPGRYWYDKYAGFWGTVHIYILLEFMSIDQFQLMESPWLIKLSLKFSACLLLFNECTEVK